MRVTIFGGSGLLGQALLGEWGKEQSRADEVLGLSSRDSDLCNPAQIHAVVERSRPDWIVLAAAYTDVDGCEKNPERAFAVNRDGAATVAEAAKHAGAKLIFLSSDYVFDGTKISPYETSDTRNPQSVYGRSKAEAELRLLEILPECCIARTSWLFGPGGKCFPDTILKLAANRPALDVVDDQRGCPTYSVDLARAIIQLCRKGASGIVHATNAGDCSWFDFALEIVAGAGLATEIRPVSSQQMARPAPRPAYSVLSAASLKPYGIVMPAWRDALHRYLAERAA
jgi:dTDP-4-dehydrorhamnose reductase